MKNKPVQYVGGINRAKLLSMGRKKILDACAIHFVRSQFGSGPAARHHRCLLAQCREVLKSLPARAYDKAAREHFGEFATPNFA